MTGRLVLKLLFKFYDTIVVMHQPSCLTSSSAIRDIVERDNLRDRDLVNFRDRDLVKISRRDRDFIKNSETRLET